MKTTKCCFDMIKSDNNFGMIAKTKMTFWLLCMMLLAQQTVNILMYILQIVKNNIANPLSR